MTVKEKELRLALVCYGGVSLAIYQHGVTKEILKLVRASRAYHDVDGTSAKQRADHCYRPRDADGTATSTESVYFDVLKAIGAQGLDLRVIVDVIAGASSGGINGIVLARALAHDLRVEPITDVWLGEVDISQLLAAEARAEPWHKWYVRPFLKPLLWELKRLGLLRHEVDDETRHKLSMFLRSRWFEPPLDGSSLSALLFDALERMGAPPAADSTLLPAGQRLDLAVTVTDYYGAERLIHLHDPPIVRERDHRLALRFAFEHLQSGILRSDFGPDNVPSLAFAARATSAYPGAFPPAQIREMDALLAHRQRSWPHREALLATGFAHYRDRGLDPEDAVLVDGSVLDNKPFHIAIEAIRSHSAFREVDRRVVYIDPNPKSPATPVQGRVPGFFGTIRGALSDLPRYDPINEELAWISRLNEQARRERNAIESVRPDVVARVEQIAGPGLDAPVDAARIRQWRIDAGRLLMAETRLTYNHYVRLMVEEAIEYVAALAARVCRYGPDSPRARWVGDVLVAWARHKGIYRHDYAIPESAVSEATLSSPLQFMVSLNLSYRFRRLHFVIQAINGVYPRLDEPAFAGLSSGMLDAFKRQVHACRETMHVNESAAFLGADTTDWLQVLFARQIEAIVQHDRLPDPTAFALHHDAALTALLERISGQCNFVRFNDGADAIMASPSFQALVPACRRELLAAYIGFVFWDIILLPMIRSRERHQLGELGEIMVDRISPHDATSLRPRGVPQSLKGAEFGGFGAFLSRTSREHDYLRGRLDAVDRLLDILASSARRDLKAPPDLAAFRKRAFAAILDEEAARLTHVAPLLEELRAAVAQLPD